MIRKIMSSILWCMASSSLLAQTLSDNPLKTRLDSVVDKAAHAYLNSGKRVAFSIGFIANHKAYTYNYGETVVGNAKMPNVESIYEIGSITKTFTGLLFPHAILEGKLALTDDVRKFLPEDFPNLQYPNAAEVKIAYLLAHVAKFPNPSIETPDKAVLTEGYFLSKLHEIKLDSLKEFKYSYSNLGYQLLGYILERIYKKSYNELIQHYIAKPLHMQYTRVSYDEIDQAKILKGYNADKIEAPAILTAFPAAGALHSSLSDMMKYLSYQMKSKDQYVKLTQKITSGNIDQGAHAIQWSMGKLWNWDYYYQIDGGTPGFRTFMMFYPDYQIGFVVLSNQTDASAGGGLYKITSTIFSELKRQLTLRK